MKFNYGDKVIITKGFYKGSKGRVINRREAWETKNLFGRIICSSPLLYYVKLRNYYSKIEPLMESFTEDQMEKLS